MINIQKLDAIANAYTDRLILPSKPQLPLWNKESLICSKAPKWNYIDGCMIKAVLMMYELNGERRLLDYAADFTDFFVLPDGSIPTMNPQDFNLDSVNGGKNLLKLYALTCGSRYRTAADNIVELQLAAQPRLDCGSFYHKAIYPRQIWLDGSYMALAFMTEYAAVNKNHEMAEDVDIQLTNMKKIMRDPKSGLYYHGYDELCSAVWADKKTGLSPHFWLRAIGWLAAALADICESAEGVFPNTKRIAEEMLGELLEALYPFAAGDGLLMQLPSVPEAEGNYPEASGTCLIAYSALKAYRLGIGGEKNKAFGEKLLSAVTEKLVKFENDMPILTNICLTAGLGGAQQRDGSVKYYLSERIVENDAKGVAPYLMAYTEIKK